MLFIGLYLLIIKGFTQVFDMWHFEAAPAHLMSGREGQHNSPPDRVPRRVSANHKIFIFSFVRAEPPA